MFAKAKLTSMAAELVAVPVLRTVTVHGAFDAEIRLGLF